MTLEVLLFLYWPDGLDRLCKKLSLHEKGISYIDFPINCNPDYGDPEKKGPHMSLDSELKKHQKSNVLKGCARSLEVSVIAAAESAPPLFSGTRLLFMLLGKAAVRFF